MANVSSNGRNKKMTTDKAVGFSGVPNINKTDVDSINGRLANHSEAIRSFRRRNEDVKQNSNKEKESDLPKDDGLNQKDNKNTNNSSSKDNGTKNTASKANTAINALSKKGGLKLKLLKIKFSLMVIGVVLSFFGIILIIGYLMTAYDTLMDSISTFFGIKESGSESSTDTLLKDDAYTINPETGEIYTTDELVEALKKDNNCSVTLLNSILDWFDSLSGRFRDPCSMTRYIQKRIADWESKYSQLHLDRSLPVSGIFHGYAAQPDYSEYVDPHSVNKVSASEHFESLVNMLKDGTLVKDDLDEIIDNAIANHTHPYYTWFIADYYDKYGRLYKSVGFCIEKTQEDVTYSLLRWKMFLRFGNKDNKYEFQGKKRSIVEIYDYLMIKKKSWEATDNECNGTESDAVLLAKVASHGAPINELDYASINKARDFLKLGNPPNMHLFEQKAEIDGYEKDVFQPHVSNYGTVIFDYKDGFAYNRFPYFKRSYVGNTVLSYDEAISPKIIESLVQASEDKKTVMNEILNFSDVDNPYAFSNFGTMWSSVKGAYCKDYVAVPFNEIEVIINDCDGREIGKTNFKDYIMGVAYGEVSDKHDEYVKAQMVAAISYSLKRKNNYQRVPTITMRSGNCDQVYCSMAQGCSSVTSSISCGSFNCTSYYPGLSYKFYHGAAGAALAQKYSRLYDEASQFLLVKDGAVFGASYVSTVQNQWYQMAASGMSFTQIMQQTYGPEGAELVRCENLDDSGSTSSALASNMGNGPTNITVKKVGNLTNETYNRKSPDLGKFYGYSYNDEPEGRNITINPEWINANIIDLKSPWNQTYRINAQAKTNYEIAFKNINEIMTNGVKISDGSICKYTSDDLKGGITFEQRKALSGLYSESSYGIVQQWNYNMSIKIDDNTYMPYSKGASISDYYNFVNSLGKEEDCRNINYILYKYAYKDAGFIWGRYDNVYDGSLFKVKY